MSMLLLFTVMILKPLPPFFSARNRNQYFEMLLKINCKHLSRCLPLFLQTAFSTSLLLTTAGFFTKRNPYQGCSFVLLLARILFLVAVLFRLINSFSVNSSAVFFQILSC